MKICLIISTLSSGGAERNASLLANFFSKKNLVSIVTFQKKESNYYNLSKKIKLFNLDLLSSSNNIFFKILNFIKRLYALNQKLKKIKPDVVISFLETMNITVLISTLFIKNIKIRIISDRNNPEKSERPLLLLILKFIFYQFCNYLVLQTNSIKKNYKFINKSKIKIIQNTISEQIVFKKRYKIKSKIRFISVGRLENQKGYDILLRALASLKKKKLNFVCDIYGVGSQYYYIKNLILILKLKNNVFLKGTKKNILKLYHNYDFYILSSRYEGFPNSLLEAMNSGIVSISSDCDYGPAEIIKNNKNGIIFQKDNFNDLSNKILELLNDKKKIFNIRRNLKKEFNPKLNNIKNYKKWQKIIKIK
jgi:GalNAc-alpha-(1->4)-GalNAc-alpha-(1->3)-diNAcBac-PP-undecaprenol alpha-1,4-N-acetyl-D-galactosaminyltransferase